MANRIAMRKQNKLVIKKCRVNITLQRIENISLNQQRWGVENFLHGLN
jgi:hypothetical protein